MIKYIHRVVYVYLGISLHIYPIAADTIGNNGISIINASGRDITFQFERQSNTGVDGDKNFTNCFYKPYGQAKNKGEAAVDYSNSMTITTTINPDTQQSEPQPFTFFMNPNIGSTESGFCSFKTISKPIALNVNCEIVWTWSQRTLQKGSDWLYQLQPTSVTITPERPERPERPETTWHYLFEKCGVIVSCPGGIGNGQPFDHACDDYDGSKFDNNIVVSVITFMNMPACAGQTVSEQKTSLVKKKSRYSKERVADIKGCIK